jgi:hypothetical protein
MPRASGALHAKMILRRVILMITKTEQQKKERQMQMQRASTTAMNRLRKKYYMDYRAFYIEELDKMGIVTRTNPASVKVVELEAEVKRLERLLAEKGGTA